MTFGSLFSGIGGLDLGLERAGMECRWQVEIDPYAVGVLEKHWPDVKRYGDITKLSGDELEPVDLVCGGFPCQDLSQAGKRAGIEGSRSGLWFEYARLVRELRPRYVLVENVPGLLVYDGMRRVVGELARLGYVGCWRSLRASEFGASHLRKRIFIVAYRERQHSERRGDRGVLEGETTEEHREASQRKRNGHAADDSVNHVAYCDDGRREDERLGGLFDGERAACGYDADGCDQDVAHGNGERCGEAGELRPGEISLPSGIGNDVAYREVRGLGELRESSGGDGLFDGSDTELGDSERTRWPQTGIRCDEHAGSEPEAGCGTLADSYRKGLEVGDGNGTGGIPVSPLATGLPSFAPGPFDPRWPCILRERPGLAPALAHTNGKRPLDDQQSTRGRETRATAECSGSLPDLVATASLESPVRRVADGISSDLDGAMSNRTKRLGRLGNAVVPQVAEWIGERIVAFEGGD